MDLCVIRLACDPVLRLKGHLQASPASLCHLWRLVLQIFPINKTNREFKLSVYTNTTGCSWHVKWNPRFTWEPPDPGGPAIPTEPASPWRHRWTHCNVFPLVFLHIRHATYIQYIKMHNILFEAEVLAAVCIMFAIIVCCLIGLFAN